MNLIAREYFRKSTLIPLLSWKIDTVTSFGDYTVEFDLQKNKVVRSTAKSEDDLAWIHEGHQGTKPKDFFGTVESDAFIVRKRKQDWLATCVVYETTLKESGAIYSDLSICCDEYSAFRVGAVLELRLAQDGPAYKSKYRVEGSCADEHRDLAEILASLLLHQNEPMDSM